MTICNKCCQSITDNNYGGEGMCGSCYDDYLLDGEYREEILHEVPLDEELEGYVEEIMNVLYGDQDA